MNIIIILALCFIDLMCGLFFGGLVGHFFSLLCFPVLALLRGVVSVIIFKVEDPGFIKNSLFSALSGAAAFYIGLVIGVLVLVFILDPRFNILNLTNDAQKIGGIGGGFVCGIFYILVYMIIALGAPALYKMLKTHN